MAATSTPESAAPAPAPLSGRQFVLENGGARAEVGSLAAVLRSLSVDGVHLTEPIGPDVLAPMGCGIVLAPWPNRVRDALWHLDGEPQQLDITEPPRRNAIHGLLRNTAYRLLLCRAPDSEETNLCRQHLADQTARFRATGQDDPAASQSALQQLCHTLLNTSELLYAR